MVSIPEVTLIPGSRAMPLVGMGTAHWPFAPDGTQPAILHAIKLGYRHFDTASLYQSEVPLGQAIVEALSLGFIKSRAELFITSKLWCNDCHSHLVLPALQKTLRSLQVDYLDLYLIHFPLSVKPGTSVFPINPADLLLMDLKSVWEAMEECHRLGLARSIGVSNFPKKHLEELLKIATIPPTVNQVEMNPAWQQSKLREFCKEKGIHVTAYSPLGGQHSPLSMNLVLHSEVMKEIAKARGKTTAQISLRWLYEQGVSMVVKSFNKERIKDNLQIFDWELSNEELSKISQIPQVKKVTLRTILSDEVNDKSFEAELLDDEM